MQKGDIEREMYARYNNQSVYHFGLLALLMVLLVTPIITPMADEILNPTEKEEFKLIDYQTLQEIHIDQVVITYVQDRYESLRKVFDNPDILLQ